jgi:nucleotide-binding universal stress UspA family protein
MVTVQHDGIAPEEPAVGPAPVVLGVSPDAHGTDRALWHAVQWASRRGVDLKLVTVVSGQGPQDSESAADERRRRALYVVNVAAHSAALRADVGLRVHAAVAVAPTPAEALVEESTRAGLLVVQRRRLSAWARLGAGSVAAEVAARAACPVLVVHGDDANPELGRAPRVLVAVDAHGHGGHALAEAFQEASWRGAVLTAVHVWQPDGYDHGALGDPRVESDMSKDVAEQLAGYAADFPDVEVRRLILQGEPASMLVEAAHDHDLVVIARRRSGRRGTRNLGSVARHVIARAHCPVLVTSPEGASVNVRPKAEPSRHGLPVE